ncbi:resolvase [Sphingobium sp. Leaf26]|uniref:recombinase family protein n=1 Tax=Sphingobium sp. Leaf26 TaxID=1735693 RepID=UPI0007011F1E|nr:recombinase family protein [Sphingobium sp. Leaf26]KQN09985.1 resolvase [Sphingobium sp. Leaf26]
MTDYVAYYRVSTRRQGASGLGLEAQRKAVTDHLRSRDQVIAEFTEVESGRRRDRPALTEAIERARLTGARLIVAKLDRLARNLHFITTLMETKVPFVAADLPDANHLTVHILSAVAQAEAHMISERTKAALAASKARGRKLGNDGTNLRNQTVGLQRSLHVRQTAARQRAASVNRVIVEAQAHGAVSLAKIAAYLNERSIRAPRGGQWSPTAVKRVVRQQASHPNEAHNQ